MRAQVLNYLRTKNMLIVLDNMEHLLSGAEILTDLLQNAPQIKLLVTSREQLRLLSEWSLEIQGLPVPQDDGVQSFESSSAVNLFMQRARQARVGFSALEPDRPSIVRICQLTQGLPLGIELAAAWSRSLTCAEIAEEIEHGLAFLETGARDLPERHRSMTAVFDYSWKLLSNEEQAVMRKLSVFQGSFSRQAVEQVCNTSIFLLSSLVDKSLVHRIENGRYELHQLIRQYAYQKLDQSGQEADVIRTEHSHYFLSLVESLEPVMRSLSQKTALDELIQDLDDIRLAWDTAIMQLDLSYLNKAAASIYYLYEVHQYFYEASRLYQRAVDRILENFNSAGALNKGEKDLMVDTLGILTGYQGFFNLRPGNNYEAEALFKRSIAWLQQVNDPAAMAFSLVHLGVIYWAFGKYELATRNMEIGLALNRATGPAWLTATALGFLGAVAYDTGDYDQSYSYLTESIEICSQIGDPQLSLFMGNYFSRTTELLGKPFEAQKIIEDNLRYMIEIGNQWITGIGLERLAMLTEKSGNPNEAHDLYEKSVRTLRNVGDKWSMTWSLLALARFSLRHDDLQTAEKCALEVLDLTIKRGLLFDGGGCFGPPG